MNAAKPSKSDDEQLAAWYENAMIGELTNDAELEEAQQRVINSELAYEAGSSMDEFFSHQSNGACQ